MSEHLEYKTKKRKPSVIEFNIDGDDYHFTPPKRALMVFPIIDRDDDSWGVAAMKSQYDWLEAGLAEGEGQRLMDRLRDVSDDFDTEDIERVFQWLMKQVNKNPTG